LNPFGLLLPKVISCSQAATTELKKSKGTSQSSSFDSARKTKASTADPGACERTLRLSATVTQNLPKKKGATELPLRSESYIM
jgi:hypothetical protein